MSQNEEDISKNPEDKATNAQVISHDEEKG
jgi:hypothetical protein